MRNRNPEPSESPRQTAAPQPDDTSPSGPALSRQRTGKIARLPRELRTLLNLMLRDGASYPTIIAKFKDLGHNLNPDNLSRWRAGGYQDWLREEAWLDEMRARLDLATDIIQEKNGALLQEASLRIAVVQMYNLLTEFDPGVLKQKMANDPRAYTRLLSCLCKLTESSLRMERARETRARSEVLRRPFAFTPPETEQNSRAAAETDSLDPHFPQQPTPPVDEAPAEADDASLFTEPEPEIDPQHASSSSAGMGMFLAAQALMAPDDGESLVAQPRTQTGTVPSDTPPVQSPATPASASKSEPPSHPSPSRHIAANRGKSRQILVGNEKGFSPNLVASATDVRTQAPGRGMDSPSAIARRNVTAI